MSDKKQEEKPVSCTPALISTDAGGIARAAACLRAGGLVAFPTETVYGLGADARSGAAVAQIYQLKGRPAFNPLIIHVDSRETAELYAVFDETARMIADVFWPGPLTLVLPLKNQPLREDGGLSADHEAAQGARVKLEGPVSSIDPLVTAGLDTVAIRVPAHKIAAALLRAFGGPVAAPSANRSGTLSPTTPLHVAQSFGVDAPMIIAGGVTDIGLESTILDVSVTPAVILRPGAVTPDDLASILGYVPDVVHDVVDQNGRPKSPGLLLKHYAPRARVRLRAVDVKDGEALLAFGSTRFMGVHGGGCARDLPEDHLRNLSEAGDLVEAAANLFRMLHDLDATGVSQIAVMDVPDVDLGLAINDRLKRAAAG